jgi:hypothetical protein
MFFLIVLETIAPNFKNFLLTSLTVALPIYQTYMHP